MDFFSENFWPIMGGGIVILIALVGVLLYLRSKRPED
jgi:uncharacterized membrane protein